jgi:hypothetical protein
VAILALTQPWPLLFEVAIGGYALVVVIAANERPAFRLAYAPIAMVVAAIPLVLLGPLPNPARPTHDLSFAGTEYVQTAAGLGPRRFLALDPPGWYSGMPDQLAAARVPDLRMFSSLDLLASNQLVDRVTRDDPDGALRRAVGVDVLATFDEPCPGREVAAVESEGGATFCRDDAARKPPFWLPADMATAATAAGSITAPRDVALDLGRIATDAVDLVPSQRDEGALVVEVDAPADGYVWIDRAWWPAWRTTVDGAPVETARALAGQLVAVPAGHHVVRQEFVPWDALVGAAFGLVALVLALAWWRGAFARISPSVRRRS